jgi:hypothetical protein
MEGTFRKEIVGKELYLYNAKGELIFKRWLNHGYSMVFTPFAYSSKDSLVSITEKDGKITHEKK